MQLVAIDSCSFSCLVAVLVDFGARQLVVFGKVGFFCFFLSIALLAGVRAGISSARRRTAVLPCSESTVESGLGGSSDLATTYPHSGPTCGPFHRPATGYSQLTPRVLDTIPMHAEFLQGSRGHTVNLSLNLALCVWVPETTVSLRRAGICKELAASVLPRLVVSSLVAAVWLALSLSLSLSLS